MTEPFVGEIRMFAGNFAPKGWALCDGQLLATSQNDALFSLFGTIYGGDGRTTFGLPDLRGRIPIHHGHGPGLNNRDIGSRGGSERVTIGLSEMPSHTHSVRGSNDNSTSDTIDGNVLAKAIVVDDDKFYADVGGAQNPLISDMVVNSGGSQSHNNMMPTLCINFIVALVGIYPSRN